MDVAETFTQAELADTAPLPAITRAEIVAQDALDDAIDACEARRGEQHRLFLSLSWRQLDELTEPGRSVWLLLDGGAIVEGWLSTQFLGTRTFWTWEPAHCRVSQFMAGVMPRVLCGCVEPIAWAPKDPETRPAGAQREIEDIAA